MARPMEAMGVDIVVMLSSLKITAGALVFIASGLATLAAIVDVIAGLMGFMVGLIDINGRAMNTIGPQ